MTIDFEQAERRFQELQAQHDRGALKEESFRVEVAKLVIRDEQGALWMLDADTGMWLCNRGTGWELADPSSEPPPEKAHEVVGEEGRRRIGRMLALGCTLLALLGTAGCVVLWLAPFDVSWNPFRPAPVDDVSAQVTIASPADGDQVAFGQAVAIESTIEALSGLQAVVRVILQVNGQTVDAQPVQASVRPGQTTFPLSQQWLPDAAGEYQVVVTALSAEDEPLGSATITLQVTEAPDAAAAEPVCVPDAVFVADVTIPPGTAFPPGVRMDKVWQVRNSGPCAWGVGYELVQVAGESLGPMGVLPVPASAASEVVDLAVTLWAPVDAGTHAAFWQLRAPDGELFGPTLPLTIHVEALAQESSPPIAPGSLQAEVTEEGTVRLTWLDRSDNEDAFRIHRADLDDSIGLAPADTGLFVDEAVACGNTYRYFVVALNAAGTSTASELAEVALPPCAPADDPPSLRLSVVPTQVQVTDTFTIVFEADDDLGLNLVVVWAEAAEHPELHSGRFFTCTEVVCVGGWPITWTGEATTTLTLLAVALDSSGQESELARAGVTIFPTVPITSP